MKHLIRPSLVAWLLTAALLSALVNQTLGATGASDVYLPIISNGHPKPGATPTTTSSPTPSAAATVTSTITPSATAAITPSVTPSVTAVPTGGTTPTSTITPTAIPTAVPQTGSTLTGNLALLPRSATTTTITTPEMFVIILDVSSTMALNFLGQATVDGTVRQCGFGPDPALNAQWQPCDPGAAWAVREERRIALEKAAVKQFIGQLGPDDRVALLPMSIEHMLGTTTPSFILADAAGKAALSSAVDAAASHAGADPYLPQGGTPAATALYRARELLSAPSTPQTAPNGREYRRSVLLLTDGTPNFYRNPTGNGQYLSNGAEVGWSNLAQDQPDCGEYISEEPRCHVGYAATTVGNLARPITAMIQEGNMLQQTAQVFVVPLAGASDEIGHEMVASQAYLPWFQRADTPDALGRALGEIINAVREVISTCEPAPYAGWAYQISPDHRPNPAGHPGIDGQTFGFATLTAENGAKYTAPIRHIQISGEDRLAYRFEQVPQGSYALSAYVLYKGDDGVTRRYDLILNNDLTTSLSRPVTVVGFGGTQVIDPLYLQFGGDLCAEAQRASGAGPSPVLGRRRVGAL